MPIPVLMPALSPTMTEGKLATWLKKEGEKVSSGDVLAEIETDKATMELEAVEEGTLGRILVKEGTEGVAVNQPIALILGEGEDASALDQAAAKAPEPAKPSVEKPEEPPKATPAREPTPAASAPANAAAEGEDRIFASPLARRLAAEKGIDLAAVNGSGPRGRIVKADVEGFTAAPKAEPAAPREAPAPVAPAAQKPADVPDFGQPWTAQPNSTMRKVIARRLGESFRTSPHFYLSVDCTIDPLLKMRAELNARAEAEKADYKISVNDFVIRASALALRKVPGANATWTDDAIRLYDDVNISVAVATPGGLITPIIFHADQKGLATISREMKDKATRARDGKLKPEEFQGGGFSISNLGMFGIKSFSAIINPPQSCILAVGAAESRPVVKDGAVAIATQMTCTLSVDHRSVDGALGAEFMAAFKRLIEDPLTMLL